MKYVLYLLFIANLILFGWWYADSQRFAPAPEPDVSVQPASLERLQLLSERTDRKPGPDTATTAAAVSSDSAAAAASARQQAAPQAEAPMPETAAAGADGAQQAPSQVAAVEPPPAPPPPPPPAPPEPLCQAIGPFPDKADVERLAQNLDPQPAAVQVRAAQSEYPADYWVYLSEMSASEARAVMRDLAARGVRDTFHGRQNFISLGVFSDKNTAERRAREIRGHGYDPKVEARYKTREVYWLDIEELPPNVIGESAWTAYLADWPEVRRQTVSCD